MLKILGFGNETGIDLPSEDEGRVPDREWKKEYFKDSVEYTVWFPGDTVNMAIGQGDLLVTPLQMAMVYSTVANRGIQYEPHLVKEVQGTSMAISALKALWKTGRTLNLMSIIWNLLRMDSTL